MTDGETPEVMEEDGDERWHKCTGKGGTEVMVEEQ